MKTHPAQDVVSRPTSGQAYASVVALGTFLFAALIGLQMLQTAPGNFVAMTGEGDGVRQSVYATLFLAATALFIRRDLGRRFPLPLGILILLAWCWLSLIWAIEPSIAIRRLTLTSMIVVSIFVLVAQAGAVTSMRTAGTVLLIALAINFLWVGMGIGTHVPGELESALIGNWRGATIHKNVAGAVCALTIIILVFFSPTRNSVVRFGAILLSSAFLLFSQSKTSMALVVVSLALGLAYSFLGPRRRGIMIPAAFIAAACVAAIGQEYLGYFSDQFTQPGGFTGRVQIWPVLLQFASEHPWLGAGYGSFWNIGEASPVMQLANNWVSRLATGHNGYLDVLVQIGIPGLILAILVTIVIPLWTLLTRPEIPSRLGSALVASLVFCAGHNMTESSLLDRDMVVWVVLAFVLAVLRQSLKEAGRRATKPDEVEA